MAVTSASVAICQPGSNDAATALYDNPVYRCGSIQVTLFVSSKNSPFGRSTTDANADEHASTQRKAPINEALFIAFPPGFPHSCDFFAKKEPIHDLIIYWIKFQTDKLHHMINDIILTTGEG
jgi:hypothetical protein